MLWCRVLSWAPRAASGRQALQTRRHSSRAGAGTRYGDGGVGPALDGMPCGQSEIRDAEVFDVLGALSDCCNLTGPESRDAWTA